MNQNCYNNSKSINISLVNANRNWKRKKGENDSHIPEMSVDRERVSYLFGILYTFPIV